MRGTRIFIIFAFVLICNLWARAQNQKKDMDRYTIVIHGGAGTILKKNMTPEKERDYKNKLNEAL